MNAKPTFAALSFFVLCSIHSAQAQVNVQYLPNVDIGPVEGAIANPIWQASFAPVPEVLRLHVPELQSGAGVLVSQVGYGIAASRYRMRGGDILLAVGDINIEGMDSIPERLGQPVVVLREGRIKRLLAAPACMHPTFMPYGGRGLMAETIQPGSMGVGGVSALATSRGNESVAISQNGNQITLEMALPNLESEPIRFNGTRESILKDLQKSKLSPAARQRVVDALR